MIHASRKSLSTHLFEGNLSVFISYKSSFKNAMFCSVYFCKELLMEWEMLKTEQFKGMSKQIQNY